MPEVLGDSPIYFSPFYEAAIYGALCELDDTNYSYYEGKSIAQYMKVRERQETDLIVLIKMLLSNGKDE